MDEFAFWSVAENAADQDYEIQQSVKRGMINFLSPKLLKISTPFMRFGVLFDDYRDHYGQDSADILVWKASSLLMNSSLADVDRLSAEKRRDPRRYLREYEAEFIEGVETFFG